MSTFIDAIDDDSIPAIKPCPCCGGESLFTIGSSWSDECETIWIACQTVTCGIRTSKRYADKADAYIVKLDMAKDLVTAWNKRVGE